MTFVFKGLKDFCLCPNVYCKFLYVFSSGHPSSSPQRITKPYICNCNTFNINSWLFNEQRLSLLVPWSLLAGRKRNLRSMNRLDAGWMGIGELYPEAGNCGCQWVIGVLQSKGNGTWLNVALWCPSADGAVLPYSWLEACCKYRFYNSYT